LEVKSLQVIHDVYGILGIQFFQDVLPVGVDRMQAEEQHVGNLFAGQFFANESCDFKFPDGQFN
jgi:hypothetical protein